MGDHYERGNPYEAYEAFDAIHAAGMSPAEFTGDVADGDALVGPHGAGAPPLVGYGASSTLRYGPGADAIPTSVTMPAGATPAMPVPAPSEAPQLVGALAGYERDAPHDQRLQSEEKERLEHMDQWKESATGALTNDDTYTSAAANGVPTGAQAGAATATTGANAGYSDAPERAAGWTVEVDETREPGRVLRTALVVGAGSLAALAIAGGLTWLIIRRRRIGAAREMREAIAASRLLRMTPAVAREDVLEATKAGKAATQYAQQTAAETAHMARALRRAASLSASTARDFATERAALAQDTVSDALDTARDGASTAWRAVSQSTPLQNPWLIRVFNAGRYAGRMEQRLK